jgi:hypothetical protein
MTTNSIKIHLQSLKFLKKCQIWVIFMSRCTSICIHDTFQVSCQFAVFMSSTCVCLKMIVSNCMHCFCQEQVW